MMKTCFVIPALHQGGAERVLTEVANWLSGSAHVTVITFDDARPFFELDERVRVHRIGNITRRVPGRPILNFCRRLVLCARIIKRIDPDVLISFMDIASVHVLLLNAVLRKRLILSEHCNPRDSLLVPLQRLVRRACYRRAAAIVSPTDEAFEIFDALHVQLPPIRRVIRNPLAAGLMPMPEAVSRPRENVLLYVGRLSPEKQVDHLIDIFSAADLPGWELHIVGDGPERAELTRYSARCCAAASRIRFLGGQRDLAGLYRSAKVLALTSRTEGLSNVLLEAMANGCVCISYDCEVGPATLIRHGLNGMLVPPQDKGRFVDALRRVAADRGLYATLQRNALRITEEVRLETVGTAWNTLIRDVASPSDDDARSGRPWLRATDVERGGRRRARGRVGALRRA